jgi:hypothetical protein
MSNGQLYRGSADFKDVTDYQINSESDSLFIFHLNNPDKYIEARIEEDTNGTSIEWYQYNASGNSYQYIRTDNVQISQMPVSANAGYMAIITGGVEADTFRCWTLINDFSVTIYNVDSIQQDGIWIKTIPTPNKWCHLLRNIKARISSADMSYFNPSTGDPVAITLNYPINATNWDAIPGNGGTGTDKFIQNDDHWLNVDIENPFWEDSWYKITIADQFGLIKSDSVFNETIEPHADFTSKLILLGDSSYYPDRYDRYYEYYNTSDYDSASAPALFIFNNLSVNAQVMTWYFGDETSDTTSADSILHTYQLPGFYTPKLVVSSTYDHLYNACTDTLEMSDSGLIIRGAKIAEFSLQVPDSVRLPNILTCPDGENNIFRFTGDVSITDFEIVILNRYGKRVYHFKGNIRDWEGWDGHDKNSEKYVSTGVYYYVVKELEVLPEYGSGREVRLESYYPPENIEGLPVSSIYRGYIHVFNTEW